MMTEEHKKEHLSHVYVYAVATSARFAYEKTGNSNDIDSIDGQIRAHGPLNDNSKLISPTIDLQLKATTICNISADGNFYRVPIKIKN